MRTGPLNSITDIAGVSVGHCQNEACISGTTVILFDHAMTASVDIRGGGPATRDTELLSPTNTVSQIDAITLTGGSAFGLDAVGGVQSFLRKAGRGLDVGVKVPIVPGAAIFDLLNQGDKDWGPRPPYWQLGLDAAQNASNNECKNGRIGAGLGATIAPSAGDDLKFGGYGTASVMLESGIMIGAAVIVNPSGSPFINGTDALWSAPFGLQGEFENHHWPQTLPDDAHIPITKRVALNNTTLGVVVTNATLSKAQCNRLAVMAQTGLARAIFPVHTPIDGDVVFAVSAGKVELSNPLLDLIQIGAVAGNTLARAIGHAVASPAQSP